MYPTDYHHTPRRDRYVPVRLRSQHEEALGILNGVLGGAMFWTLLGYVVWRVA